jgi:hypothetical protein
MQKQLAERALFASREGATEKIHAQTHAWWIRTDDWRLDHHTHTALRNIKSKPIRRERELEPGAARIHKLEAWGHRLGGRNTRRTRQETKIGAARNHGKNLHENQWSTLLCGRKNKKEPWEKINWALRSRVARIQNKRHWPERNPCGTWTMIWPAPRNPCSSRNVDRDLGLWPGSARRQGRGQNLNWNQQQYNWSVEVTAFTFLFYWKQKIESWHTSTLEIMKRN